MTAQQLKNSILQMAVQGKLVPQDPNDEPASVLLERIKAEKQELIKAGKIKKDKKSSEIFRGASRNIPYAFCEQIGKEIRDISDEIPFDIPDSWEWCRLGELIHLIGGTSYKKNEIVKNGLRIIRGGNIQNNELQLLDDDVFLDPCFTDDEKLIKNGDIIFVASTGSKTVIGKPAFIRKSFEKVQIGAFLRIARPIDPSVKEYLFLIFSTEYYRKAIRDSVKGTNINNIKAEYINNLLVPFPSLDEQHRIVAKIEELLPFIEKYGKAEEHLTALNTTFPEALKKSILQEAVQGKLVPQNPDDEPASVLLERIRAEKQALIKAGKIKKDKHESVIVTRDKIPYEIIDGKERCIADEVPFELPDSWCWCRISNLFSVGTGMTPLKSEEKFYKNATIPWVNSSQTSDRYINYVDTYVTDYALDNTSLVLYEPHTLVIAMYGQGKTRGQVSELLIPATVNQACAALTAISYYQEMIEYVYYFFVYNYEMMRKKAEGTSQPNLNIQKIKDIILPFPPFSEQKRIVEKIEELLPLSEMLK